MSSNSGSKKTKRQSYCRAPDSQSVLGAPAPPISLDDPQLLNHPLKAGALAPSFSLRALDGTLVRLSELVRVGPIVLSFHAGTRCESCQSHLSELGALLPKIRQLGARWVAIGPKSSHHRAKTVRASLLSDPGARVAKAYGVAIALTASNVAQYQHSCHAAPRETGTQQGHLFIPATYVIDRNNQVVYTCAALKDCSTIDPAEIVTLLTSLRDREDLRRPRART